MMPIVRSLPRGLSCGALFFALLSPMNASSETAHAPSDTQRLRVLKSGPLVFVRSRFSVDKDLVVTTGLGANRQVTFFRTYLVPIGAGMTPSELSTGLLIHEAGDDSTPWNLNGTYIGANHGCSDVVETHSVDHGLTTADIGSGWKDKDGVPFFVVRIPDKDTLWFLSENRGTGPVWKFVTQISGARLEGMSGNCSLAVESQKRVQLTPALRFRKQEFLADGKAPLVEGMAVECEFLDVVEEQEIINPGDVLASVLRHPGVEPDCVGEGLAAVIRNRIVYRFHPNGSTVIDTHSDALQEFEMGYMGFVQSAKLSTGEFDTHEYFVPDTLPFETGGNHYDFQALQDYRQPLPQPVYFSEKTGNLLDPKRPPDRFLQLLGKNEGGEVQRKVGFVLGYSPVEGLTAGGRRAETAEIAAMLYVSNKSYPRAVDRKLFGRVPAGTVFQCTAYRQYFDPSAAAPATNCYWNRQGDKIVIYADFHKQADRIRLPLPGFLTGKNFEIIEKSPSVTLQAGSHIPEEGLRVSSDGTPGSLVLGVEVE